MKRVIKATIKANSNFDLIKDATCNAEIKDGYREEFAHGYIGRKTNGKLSINKPRPYDDAEYYWALYDYDKLGWKIVYKGKVKNILLDEDYEIDDVVDMLEMLNSSVEPKMVHN